MLSRQTLPDPDSDDLDDEVRPFDSAAVYAPVYYPPELLAKMRAGR